MARSNVHPIDPNKPNPALAKFLKEEGMERVLNREWRDKVYAGIKKHFIDPDWRGTWESMRVYLIDNGFVPPPPGHSNAHGAVCNGAIKRGLIAPTGIYEHTKTPLNHHCKRMIYRRRFEINEPPKEFNTR